MFQALAFLFLIPAMFRRLVIHGVWAIPAHGVILLALGVAVVHGVAARRVPHAEVPEANGAVKVATEAGEQVLVLVLQVGEIHHRKQMVGVDRCWAYI